MLLLQETEFCVTTRRKVKPRVLIT